MRQYQEKYPFKKYYCFFILPIHRNTSFELIFLLLRIPNYIVLTIVVKSGYKARNYLFVKTKAREKISFVIQYKFANLHILQHEID
jgi:hypothetical protein